MWCISLTVQSVLGMPRPVVPLSLSHPGWASCTTTGTTPTTSTPTMLVVTYKRGVTPSEFSLARASTQGWYNTQVISPPFLHHCLCIEWTVNSEQVGYPAYLQNNCYSLIVIPRENIEYFLLFESHEPQHPPLSWVARRLLSVLGQSRGLRAYHP